MKKKLNPPNFFSVWWEKSEKAHIYKPYFNSLNSVFFPSSIICLFFHLFSDLHRLPWPTHPAWCCTAGLHRPPECPGWRRLWWRRTSGAIYWPSLSARSPSLRPRLNWTRRWKNRSQTGSNRCPPEQDSPGFLEKIKVGL